MMATEAIPRLKFGHDESIAIRDREIRKMVSELRQSTMRSKFETELLAYFYQLKLRLDRFGDPDFARERMEDSIAEKTDGSYPWQIKTPKSTKKRAEIRKLYKVNVPSRLRLDLVHRTVLSALGIAITQATITISQ